MKYTSVFLMLLFVCAACADDLPLDSTDTPQDDPLTWWDDPNCRGLSTCPNRPDIEYIRCCYGSSCAYTFEDGRLAFNQEQLQDACTGTTCLGTPTGCEEITDGASCGRYYNCDWSRGCEGTRTPCESATVKDDCKRSNGCIWSTPYNGTPHCFTSDDRPCVELAYDSCTTIDGCQWFQGPCVDAGTFTKCTASKFLCDRLHGCSWGYP